MVIFYAARRRSSGASFGGTAAAMTMYPIVPDLERFPEVPFRLRVLPSVEEILARVLQRRVEEILEVVHRAGLGDDDGGAGRRRRR